MMIQFKLKIALIKGREKTASWYYVGKMHFLHLIVYKGHNTGYKIVNGLTVSNGWELTVGRGYHIAHIFCQVNLYSGYRFRCYTQDCINTVFEGYFRILLLCEIDSHTMSHGRHVIFIKINDIMALNISCLVKSRKMIPVFKRNFLNTGLYFAYICKKSRGIADIYYAKINQVSGKIDSVCILKVGRKKIIVK